MLYLPELSKLNNDRVRQLLNPEKPTVTEVSSKDYIIVVHKPGHSKSYYDRGEYYVTNRNTVRGWSTSEFEDVKKRASNLESFVHSDTKVSVDRRG